MSTALFPERALVAGQAAAAAEVGLSPGVIVAGEPPRPGLEALGVGIGGSYRPRLSGLSPPNAALPGART